MLRSFASAVVFLLAMSAVHIPHPVPAIAQADTIPDSLLLVPRLPFPSDGQEVAVATDTQAQTEGQVATAALPVEKLEVHSGVPERLVIPSIDLNVPVVGVGVNGSGEMDVPDGSSKSVGWYKYGTLPGNWGSAVLDAHVFAAFSDLRSVKVGSDIYVKTSEGENLHFVVTDSRLYKLGELPPEYLFARADARRLNLITCAGKLLPDGSTYDHRLVVYAELVEA